MTDQKNDIPRILIIAPSWVGDMVMSQTLFQLIKRRAQAQIDVLAPAYIVPLVKRMPEVHTVIPVDLKHGEWGFFKRYRIGKSLRALKYDQAIVLPNSFKSAFIPFFAGIPLRTGWRGEWRYGVLNDVRILDKQKFPLMIERFMALGLPKGSALKKPYSTPALSVSEDAVQNVTQRFQIQKKERQPVLAICPGAEYGPAKQWPPKHCAFIANALLDQGWNVWLFGSKKDQAAADLIMEQTQGRCGNWVGKTALGEAIDLLSLCSVVLTNDSGLMHVAAALNKPLIAIYGSSSPAFTPPLSEKAQIVSLKLPCSPCFKRTCPFGHYRCLNEITPEMILRRIAEIKSFE
ncbi:MAG: lipopolysaccharide heptosyltransferase II [Pseudomonadota bacterium]|nr:lipopolysaccharide heptosyltransferase II [Gammaproteobacteria bacterium]MBU1558384.1 lipopolysaccharide heptosyltransferase II [Gammaproteobacteria bacterium]MBU1629214.1 lipopolysaccharide heptosyltransferase II [Gammaproteobacteria bacterium]MBU1927291.1 lipopolysaccharide heptosyltransferase II [Gammaproteobacteria bacterium]MBU2546330.1 lipopolysaccharide heptosyltransferase II [Gammaproteobacteria bacterium]